MGATTLRERIVAPERIELLLLINERGRAMTRQAKVGDLQPGNTLLIRTQDSSSLRHLKVLEFSKNEFNAFGRCDVKHVGSENGVLHQLTVEGNNVRIRRARTRQPATLYG